MLKKQQDDYEEKKKLKAVERAKRIVIKGRKVFEDVAPWQNKKKQIKLNESDEDEDDQYLYYSDEDDD